MHENTTLFIVLGLFLFAQFHDIIKEEFESVRKSKNQSAARNSRKKR